MALAFATVGALIAARHPRNPIGWLCVALGLVVAVTDAGDQYAIYALVTAPGSLPGGDWAAWLAVWPVELTVLLPVLVFLLFPQGHLLAPGWRPLVWLAVGTSMFTAAASALSTVNFPDNVPFARHPMALIDADAVRLAYGALQLVELGVLLLAGVSLVVRLGRARGQERQQLKWFTYVSAVGALAITGAVFVTDQPVIVAVFWFPAVAIAIGVAIFKYRLYDIDRIINRTLVYGLLTALLGAVYVGLVLVLGQLFGGVTGNPPSWAVAAATLAVAAVFRPARHRIQTVVDRRFNRRRHDASTGVATTRPRPSRGSAPACATSSTSTPSRPRSSRSLTRPWSRPGSRSGFDPPHLVHQAHPAGMPGQLPGPTELVIHPADRCQLGRSRACCAKPGGGLTAWERFGLWPRQLLVTEVCACARPVMRCDGWMT